MSILKLRTCYFLLFFIFFDPSLGLASQQIRVVDQNGQPLSHVVLEIFSGTDDALEAQNVEIDQVDKAFKPYLSIIPKGSSVDFPNSDNIRHHVYSFSETKVFEIKLYADRPSQPIVFDDEGVVVLGCNIHDSMVAYVYVASSKLYFESNQAGIIEVKTLPEHVTRATLWHPRLKSGVDTRYELTLTRLLSEQGEDFVLAVNAPVKRNTFEDVFK